MIAFKKIAGFSVAMFVLICAVAQQASAQANCSYRITNEWNTGYTGAITISNNGSSSLNGWSLSWQYNSNRITSSWNANITGNNPYTATDLGWNGNVPAGASVEIGFQVNKNGGSAEMPTLNGAVCSGGNNNSSATSSVSSSPSSSASSQSVAPSSSASSISSSSANNNAGQQCNWYGTLYPLCTNTQSGWGWEANRSCISPSTCSSQPAPYVIVGGNNSSSSSSVATSSSSSAGNQGFVSTHGQLRTSGNQLINKNGTAVQLRGMSSHGLQWYGDYMNLSSIRWLRDDWGINVIRAAMYTASEGYIEDPSVKNKVFEIVDAAIALDIYVIVDWHILSDGNPQQYKAEAKAFFNEVAQRYGNTPNVIYEIANEPNGGGVTWNAAIRPYAQEVIPVIRNHAPNSLVIVGTGTWSQDVTDAAANPVSFPNVGYAMHFYACTHGQWLRDRVDQARAQGAMIFSTEWGTADATGDGSVCENDTRTWINFLNQRGISWINWSITPKEEGTAALNPGASTTGNWSASDLSPSGTLVKSLMRQ